MDRLSALLLVFCFGVASCNAQQTGTPEVPAAPEVPITKAEAQTEEGTDVANDFEGLCKIAKGAHVPSVDFYNTRTTSNGISVAVSNKKGKTSLRSINGKSVVRVGGGAILHLTFADNERVSVEVNPAQESVEITIDGPDAITCKSAI